MYYVIGICYLLLAQLMVSLNIILSKVLVESLSIFIILTLRFFVGSAFSTASVLLTKPGSLAQLTQLTRGQWWLLLAQSACAGFLFNVLMLIGIHFTTATEVGLIASLIPLMIMLLSFFILREHLTTHAAIAVLIALSALIIVNLGNSSSEEVTNWRWLGNSLIFLALIPEAMFAILTKWRHIELPSPLLTLIANVMNTLLFLPFLGFTLWQFGWPTMTGQLWLLVIAHGFTGGLLFFIFWYQGIQRCPSHVVAVTAGFMPVATAILAIILLGETLTVHLVIATLLIVASLLIGARRSKQSL
jgi:drug/metabolite transporter (DMT)-like permease